MPEETVEGVLVFGDDAAPVAGATIEIVLEDVTLADARAVPVARAILRGVTCDGAAGESVPFSLRRPQAAPERRQTLRVLVDVDGDGRLGRGDYRNAESVRVPAGSTRELVVRLVRVR